MIFTVAIILTWVAAAYRIWIFATRPRTVWRGAIAVSMTATAIAFTVYRARSGLDGLLGLPNLAGLLARLVFALAMAFLVIYMDALRRLDARAPTVVRHIAVSLAVCLIMIVAWVAAPIHDVTVDDMSPLAGYTSVVVYCLAFWAYLVWALVLMSWTSIARARQFRREDSTRSVSLVFKGVAAAAAIPTLLLWSASVLITRVTGRSAPTVRDVGDDILPWALLLNALGALSLLALPYLAEVLTTRRRLRRLSPLWSELISRYPEVHLDLRLAGGPLTRLQLRTERAIIEIHDALRIATVDLDGPASVEALAVSLHDGGRTGRRASDLLERVTTRDADVRQLLELARAFEASRP